MDKFTRLLSLVALLEQSARPKTFEEIREELPDSYTQSRPETARRAFERDKKDLLDMGVPLRTLDVADDPSGSAYVIRRERSAVADPGFTGAELAALRMAATAMALRDEGAGLADATDGLRKYGGMGPAGDGPTLAEIRLDSNVTELFSAILNGTPVAFTHSDRTRKVLPQHLWSMGGHWYLTCHDLDAGASRTYRLDRLEGAVLPVEPAEERAEKPAAGIESSDAAGPGGRFRPWEFGDGPVESVTISLDAPSATVALAEHPGLEVVEAGDDHTVVRLDVRNREGLFSWLLSFIDRAELVGPPDVRDAFVDHVSGIARAGSPQ